MRSAYPARLYKRKLPNETRTQTDVRPVAGIKRKNLSTPVLEIQTAELIWELPLVLEL